MNGQKERITIVGQSIDWKVVEYMDVGDIPIDGIIPLNRPDKLADERVYGLNTVRLGDQVWVVDGSRDAGSTPVHLEELELEKKTVKWEEKVEKPEEAICPECGGDTSEGVRCGYCGKGLKTVSGTKQMEKPIDRVIAREKLEPELTGGVGEIKQYLTEQFDEESENGESTVFDTVWDGMMKSAGEAGEGLKDMLVGILPEAMASIVKNIPAESLIKLMGADRLKQLVRETMVGVMLAGETVQSGAQGLISKIPGLAELVEAKGELALYGPFHENEIEDGRIVVVKDGDEKKAAAKEMPSASKEIMAVPVGLELIEEEVEFDPVLDANTAGPVYYSTLVDEDLEDLGLMMIYAKNGAGDPYNLFIPMSHLEKWDIRRENMSLWDELERIAQAGEVKSHTFGNLSANYVTEGYPTPRFALTRMGVNDKAYVNVSWGPGMEIVRRQPVESAPATMNDIKSVVVAPVPEVAEARQDVAVKKDVEKPTAPSTVVELARRFEQLGMESAGIALRGQDAKVNSLRLKNGEYQRAKASPRWGDRFWAVDNSEELEAEVSWLIHMQSLCNSLMRGVSTSKDLNLAWKKTVTRAAGWLAVHQYDSAYPDEWKDYDALGEMSKKWTVKEELNRLTAMLETWSDGMKPTSGWKTPVHMFDYWNSTSSKSFISSRVGKWGNDLGDYLLRGE